MTEPPVVARRRPNPWIAIPALLAGLLAAALGWIVTDVSCRVEIDGVVQHCRGWASLVAVITFIGATIGMTVVLVLVYRSLAEYREAAERGAEPPDAERRTPNA